MLLVEVPWASRVWALPFLCALAPSERYAAKRGKRHKKITEWAWQLLLQVRRWYPQRQIVAVADRAYASLKLLSRCRSLSKPVTFITRLRLDAALYEPAPPRRPGQRGRPRLKGERLPNLSEVADDPRTLWKLTMITNWYGERERVVEIASETAVWYSTGLFAVPIRWVLIRDPKGEFKTQALLCTDLNADPKLDFSHFQKGRVGYAGHRSVERGEPYAYPTDHDDTGFGTVCATFLRARLRACPGVDRRCDPYSGKTHRQLGLASDGSGSAEDLPSLPSGVEPCEVV